MIYTISQIIVLFDIMIAWLLIPSGILIIVYCEKVVGFIGEIPFAEKYIGGGGTYTFVKILGLLMTIMSFMWITGGLDTFLKSTLGIFIPGTN